MFTSHDHRSLRLLVFIFLGFSIVPVVQAQRGGTRVIPTHAQPNIVVFISDDHGYFDSPLFGNDDVFTPSMERIAKDGVMFTHAYVGSPTCAPSRAIMGTGLMSVRNGAEPNHSKVKAGLRTLPQTMTDLGYRVASFGKCLKGPIPNDKSYYYEKGNAKAGQAEGVVSWLSTYPTDKPLCLLVGTHEPHVKWPEPKGYDASSFTIPPKSVDTPETRRRLAQYYTDITTMDTKLGMVYDAVWKYLGDNTLFIYTGDNGAQWPFGKWNLYDTGIRSPMLGVWPDILEPNTVSDALLGWVDFLPTFMDLAGAEPPADLDGRSFAGLLRGETTQHRENIFAQHTSAAHNTYPMRCVVTPTHKLILNLYPDYVFTCQTDHNPNSGGHAMWKTWINVAQNDAQVTALLEGYHTRPAEEFYDLTQDPYEEHNLAQDPEQAELVSQLRQTLLDWMETQGDQRNPHGNPQEILIPVSGVDRSTTRR